MRETAFLQLPYGKDDLSLLRDESCYLQKAHIFSNKPMLFIYQNELRDPLQ